METCEVGAELLDLRRHLVAKKQIDGEGFHCTTDKQAVRDEVFGVLKGHNFAVDSTILEKRKALPRISQDEAVFYKYAWYYHAKDLLPRRFKADDNVLISAAALDTKRGKAAFRNAFNEVIQQTGKHLEHTTVFHLSKTDPCLQAADYCAWALQRKWEREDGRSYDLIAGKLSTEFNLWKYGKNPLLLIEKVVRPAIPIISFSGAATGAFRQARGAQTNHNVTEAKESDNRS